MLNKPYSKEITIKEPKEFDPERAIKHLNYEFARITMGMGWPKSPYVASSSGVVKRNPDHKTGNDLYRYQVEFCYMIDEIRRGVGYTTQKVTTQCNELLAEIELAKKQQEEV